MLVLDWTGLDWLGWASGCQDNHQHPVVGTGGISGEPIILESQETKSLGLDWTGLDWSRLGVGRGFDPWWPGRRKGQGGH